MNTESLIGEMYVPRTATPAEAGKTLGHVWCDVPVQYQHIDAWGEDWVGQELIHEFLNVCKDRGCLLEALQVRWLVHNCPGPEYEFCGSDIVDWWTIQWVCENLSERSLFNQLQDNDILVSSFRKMYQHFRESLTTPIEDK